MTEVVFNESENRWYVYKAGQFAGYARPVGDKIGFVYKKQFFTHDEMLFGTEVELADFVKSGGKCKSLKSSLKKGL